MELSVELLQSTIRALKSDLMEQRRHPRAPVRAKVKIVPYNKSGALDKPLEVWTRDISSGGLGVICSAALPVGGKFVLRLPRSEGQPMYLLCTIKNCVQQAKGIFVIGATFTEPQFDAAPKKEDAHAKASTPEGDVSWVIE